MKAVELFSGAGGILLALKDCGIDILFSNEVDHKFAQTHYHNFPSVPLIEDDIKNITTEILNKATNGENIDLVTGGPPCQGFSIFGKRRFVNTKGYEPQKDPRNKLVYEFIRVVATLKPKFFLMENVKGFMSLDSGFFVESIKNEFKKLGYSDIWCDIVCAADYGVPQLRHRMFMIGNRIGINFIPPANTHFPKNSGKEPSYNTVGQAIMDLVNNDRVPNNIALQHKPTVAARMGYVMEGGRLNINELPLELLRATRRDSITGKVSNYSHIYKRLDRKTPAWTMVPGHNAFPIHPTLNRTLTPREAARIQSFPDSHVFFGTRQEQCIQVGNAVPPEMVKPFIMQIKKYLE